MTDHPPHRIQSGWCMLCLAQLGNVLEVINMTKNETTSPAKVSALLTPEETAESLGVSVRTLSIWRCQKRYPELRYTKIGRLVRYRAEDVQSFINQRLV